MLQPAESTHLQKPGAASNAPWLAQSFSPGMEQATLGATIVVKGEITGTQALYIDGRVEGSIILPGHRVTVGRSGVVLANIAAKEVVLMGRVTGNIECSDRVDIRADAVLTGDVATQRISVDAGAVMTGSIEVRRPGVAESVVEAAAETEPLIESVRAVPAELAATIAAASARPIMRVAGSQVLYED